MSKDKEIQKACADCDHWWKYKGQHETGSCFELKDRLNVHLGGAKVYPGITIDTPKDFYCAYFEGEQ